MKYMLFFLGALAGALVQTAGRAGPLFFGPAPAASLPITGSAAVTVSAPLIFAPPPVTGDATWAGKIVLVDRAPGTTFADTLAKVKASGGVGLIVANNVPGNFQGNLGSGVTSPLPGVTVSQADGAKLKAAAGSIATIGGSMPPPPPAPAPENKGQAIVSNGAGWDLVTIGAPATVFAAGSTVPVGASISFTVQSDGAAPLSFQWLKDGVPIPSATAAVLFFGAVQASDAGSYVCAVSNAGGVATSAAYKLAVGN